MIEVWNKYGKITFRGFTEKTIRSATKKSHSENLIKLRAAQRDNSINKNCILIESIKNNHKRLLIEIYDMCGKIKSSKHPADLIVDLAGFGFLIEHNGYYSLTRRGVYYASKFKSERY